MLGQFCVGVSYRMSLQLQSFKGSSRLDIQDGTLMWLTVEAGCWLAGSSAGTVNQSAFTHPLQHVRLLTWQLASLRASV